MRGPAHGVGGPGLEPARSELRLSGLELSLYLSSEDGRAASGWSRSRGLLTRRAEHLSRLFLMLAPDQCSARFPDSAHRPKLLLAGPAQCASWEANSLQRLVKHWPTLGGGRGPGGCVMQPLPGQREQTHPPLTSARASCPCLQMESGTVTQIPWIIASQFWDEGMSEHQYF